MNTRIHKDIRLIAGPFAVGAAALALLTVTGPFSALLGWVAACTLLVAAGFAGELTPHGLSMSLAMPVDRRRLWLEKLAVVGVGLVLLTLLLLALDLFRGPVFNVRSSASIFLASFPLFALGMGSLVSLWTRQPIATVWLVLLGVGLVFILSDVLLAFLIPAMQSSLPFHLILIVLAVYGAVRSRCLFLEFEDDREDATGRWIDLNSLLGRKALAQSTGARSHYIPALIRKELALQQINLVLAGVILVSMVASGLILFRTVPEWAGHISLLTKTIALFAGFTAGAVAFSEEKRLGLSEFMLTIPAHGKTQFRIKMGIAMGIGVVLSGGGMLLIDGLLHWLGGMLDFTPVFHLSAGHALLLCLFAPMMAVLAGGFAASMTRNFLSAISLTLLIGVILFGTYLLYINWILLDLNLRNDAKPHALLLVTSVPILAMLFIIRSRRNFQNAADERTIVVRSIIGLAASMVLILAINSFMIWRAWELFEPSPTNRQFSQAPEGDYSKDHLFLSEGVWRQAFAIAMDGTLWELNPDLLERPFSNDGTGARQIGTDADWVEVVDGWEWFFARKEDGSLWVGGDFQWPHGNILPDSEISRLKGNYNVIDGRLPQPARVFPEFKWNKLVEGHGGVETMAIRDDGTLWMWGKPGWLAKPDAPSTLNVWQSETGQLVQLGMDSDWVEVVRRAGVYFGLKSDGSVWVWGNDTRKHVGLDNAENSLVPERLDLGNTIVTHLITFQSAGVIARQETGPALMFSGNWVNVHQAIPFSESIPAIPVRMERGNKEFHEAHYDLYLTQNDLLMVRPLSGGAQPIQTEYRGSNWVYQSSGVGGFTRDGSLWLEPGNFRTREASIGEKIAVWLNLEIDTTHETMIPPRWRLQRIGRLHEIH